MTGRRLDWVAFDEVSTITPEQWAAIDRLTDEYMKNRNLRFNDERTTMRFSERYGYATEAPAVPVQDEIKAWVKVPTLHPKDPNALLYLGAGDLDVLISRANVAKQKIEAEKKAREEARRPLYKVGQRVRHVYSSRVGTVLDTKGARAMFEAVTGQPAPSEPRPGREPRYWVLLDGETTPGFAVQSSLRPVI